VCVESYEEGIKIRRRKEKKEGREEGRKGGREGGREEGRKGLLDKVKKYRQQRNYSGGHDHSLHLVVLEETKFILKVMAAKAH